MKERSRAFGLENMWASHVLRTILTQIGRFFRNLRGLNRGGRAENWRLQASGAFIYSYLFVPVGKEENNKLTSGPGVLGPFKGSNSFLYLYSTED